MTDTASTIPDSPPRAPLWRAYLLAAGHGTTHWTPAAFFLMMPLIEQELKVGYTAIGFVMTVYYICSTLTNIIGGFAVDKTGRTVLVMMTSLLIGVVGITLIGFSTTYFMICAFAGVLGFSSNLWHPASFSYLSSHYPERRGLVFGIHATGANLGDAIAPLSTGALLSVYTWHETTSLVALAPLSLAILVTVFLLGGERNMVRANRAAGKKPMSLADYGRGVKGLAKSRFVLTLCLVSGLRSVSQNGLFLFLPLFLMHERGISPILIGLTISALQIGGALIAPIAGHWSDRMNRKMVARLGFGAAIVLVLSLTQFAHVYMLVPIALMLGVALYSVRPVLQGWLMDMTPDSIRGTATSGMFGVQSLMSAITPVIGGFVADSFGLQSAFYFIAFTMFAAIFATSLVPSEQTKLPEQEQETPA